MASSYLMLAVRVDEGIENALDLGLDVKRLLERGGFQDVTVLNTIPAPPKKKKNLRLYKCTKCDRFFRREDLLAGDGSFIGWCVECDNEHA